MTEFLLIRHATPDYSIIDKRHYKGFGNDLAPLTKEGEQEALKVSEEQIDIVTAISGSGPAFYYKVINDIARAGEKLGLDYQKALTLSIQTAIGSAKMLLSSDKSAEELISSVATKGGCTRVGVDYLEDIDSADIFYNLIEKTAEKAHALGK